MLAGNKIFSQDKASFSGFGSAGWKLSSDYLASNTLRLRTIQFTSQENSEPLNSHQSNTLSHIFMSLIYNFC